MNVIRYKVKTNMSSIRGRRLDTSAAEQGIVAIFSVMIIMGILTLLIIGYSNITRQAQQRTLNEQLNTQAFYAAESGINEARRALLANIANPSVVNKTDCQGGSYDYQMDPILGIEYTCLLIDVEPPSAVFDGLNVAGEGEPIVTRLESADGSVIASINVNWDSWDPNDSAINRTFTAGSPTFPTETIWASSIGALRVDLVPVSAALDRAATVNSSYTFFLYPSSNGAIPANNSVGVVAGVNNQAGTLITNCSSPAPYRCRGRINIIGGSTAYYMRIQAYYNAVSTEFVAYNSVGSVSELRNGQALIDATGKAADVYRRVQVHVPIRADASYFNGLHEAFSLLTADSLCKRIVGAPQGAPGTGSIVSGGAGDPACNI